LFQRLACVVVYCSCVNPVHTKQRGMTVLNLNHNSSPHKVPNSLCKGAVCLQRVPRCIDLGVWIMTKGNIYWSMPHQTSMFPFHETVSNSYCISLYEYCLFYQCITSAKLSLLVFKCIYCVLFWYDVTFIYTRKYNKITFEHTQLKPYIFNRQTNFVLLIPSILISTLFALKIRVVPRSKHKASRL